MDESGKIVSLHDALLVLCSRKGPAPINAQTKRIQLRCYLPLNRDKASYLMTLTD